MIRAALLAFLLLTFAAGPAFGQAHRSTISGRVTDATGSAVAGAEVHVIQKSTNVDRVTRTNADGYYEVPGLFPGDYRVEARQTGFKTAVTDNIPVTSGRTVGVDLRIEVGEVKESVTVTAERQVLDTESADVNTVIGTKAVSELPIGQGHATYLFLMVPGADAASSAGRGGNGMDIQPLQRQGTSQTRFNGGPQGTTEYTLDGTPNTQRGNSLPGGGSAFNPSADIVQEVRVQTATFDASVGHSGGATVDLVLKAGTNQYHGAALGFFRNPNWNANSWAANRGGVPRQDFTYRRWGFSGGGPVWLGPLYKGTNRTFFFYGFEKWSSLSPNPAAFVTIPTPEQLNGDFSSLLRLGPQYQLYDPDTARAATGGRIQRTPFAGNVIPASRIHPIAKTLSRLWPSPNTQGTADNRQNFSFNNAPNPRRYWASTLRLDHNLSNSHKLFGRFVASDTAIPFDTLYGRTDFPGLNFQGRNRDVAVSDVWTVSPSLIADFRASVMRFHWNTTPLGLGVDYREFGLEGLSSLLDTSRIGIPAVVVSDYSAFANSAGSRTVSEIRTGAAHFTKISGTHSLKFGADMRWYIDNRGTDDLVRLTFSGAYSRGPLDNSPAPPIGAGLSDFLLGRFASATVSQPSKAANLSTYQGLYFQDNWKMTPTLTLNLGVRYEREGPPTERFNRALAGFDFNAASPIAAQARAAYASNPIPEVPLASFQPRGGLLYAGEGGQSRKVYNADNNNFAPRVGLAWQVTKQTVVRTGYGIYYIPYGQRFFANEGGVPGFDVTSNSFSTQDNGLTFNRSINNLFPTGLDRPTGSTLGLGTFLGQGFNLRAFGDNPNAYSQRWQFAVQRRFGSDYRTEVRYVGNRTLKMPIQRSMNPIPNEYLSRSPERDIETINRLSTLVPNPFFGLPGVGGNIGTSRTIARSQLLRPYPQFGNITYFDNQGWTNYHALQAELERALSNGMTFQMSYTWSKTLDGLEYLNDGDPATERVIAATDHTHIWRFVGLYELPFGRGRRDLAGRLAGGWQIQAITFAESGVPLSWGNVLFRGNIKDIEIDGQTPERMFNAAAGFERDARFQLASNVRTFPSRLNGVRSTAEFNTDFSVIKNTTFGERYTLQFRGEAYNVFNQHFFVNAVTAPQNTAFGTSTTASSPRSVQLGLRFIF